MGDSSEEEEGYEAEAFGEGFHAQVELPGEQVAADVIREKVLTFELASKCLNTLGSDESSLRYAYISFAATNQKLTDIRMLTNFRHVLFVDVSGNYLDTSALQAICAMPFLLQFIAQRNLAESAALKPMCYLQELSLSHNRIHDTVGIIQPIMEFLDLNYNQIYQIIFNQEDVPVLKELELRGNFLFEVGGVIPSQVEKLYLAENRITHFVTSDIGKLDHLQVLHLRHNLIRKLDGFTNKLQQLKYLNLRENKINKLRQFRKLDSLPSLEVLVITDNPVAGEVSAEGEEMEGEEPGEGGERIDPNRVALLVLLPKLTRINKNIVTFEEREHAKRIYEDKLLEIMEVESSDEEVDDPPTTATDLPTTTEPMINPE